MSKPVDDNDDDNCEALDTFLDLQKAVVGAWAFASKAVPSTGPLPKAQFWGGQGEKEEVPLPVLEPEPEQHQKTEPVPKNEPVGGSGTDKAEGEGVGRDQEATVSSPITSGGKKGKKKGKN